MKNDKSIFNFWLVYEKVVGQLPEKVIENPEADILKKALIEGNMADISFNSVILPFSIKKKQEESLRNLIDIMIVTDKIEDFDYDLYYNQYLQKQKAENKELPLTDFVQILIDNNIIPAINYKDYEEQFLSKRIVKEKTLDNIVKIHQDQNNNGEHLTSKTQKIK